MKYPKINEFIEIKERRINMKKILPLLLPIILTACADSDRQSQMVTQTSEEVIVASTPIETEIEMGQIEPPPAFEDELSVEETPKPSGFTIQVLSLSDPNGFQPYISKLPENTAFWSNKKDVSGKDWYALLYGEFATMSEAKDALDKLPANIKKFGPYIRSFTSIEKSSSPDIEKL